MMEKNSAWREEYHFANCVIRSDTRELLRDGVVQKIERRSFDLILYLLKLEGRVASKDELLEHVWGNHFVSESVIAQSIMKVRKALGITGKEPGPIKTIHRVGYRFASEVRTAIHMPHNPSPAPRLSGPKRVLWLPTDCALSRADLSWVRYGLMSVASHVLNGHGVLTVPASEAIRLHESPHEDGSPWTDEPPIREIGMPTVRSRLTAQGERFRFDWWMQIDGVGHGNQVEGAAPAELALRAAREVALTVRLPSALPFTTGQETKFWEDAGRLVALAVSLDQAQAARPLMSICVERSECPLDIWAECVLDMAQRADEATPTFIQRMLHRAQTEQDRAFEGWAQLCMALHHQLRRRTPDALELALSGVTMVRQATTHALHARALLLAAQVLATAGRASEAAELWREAASRVSQTPSPDMVCRVHLLRCELDHMGMAHTGLDPLPDGLASVFWLGLTPMTAKVWVLQGLLSCARGEWETCRQQLDRAVRASDKGLSASAGLFAHLQLGNFHARCGDQTALVACLNAVDQPALRCAPLGSAVGRWLQARRWYLEGDVAQALSLAEAALGEMADQGVWCGEDQWLFVAQMALIGGNRRAARALLQRLQARQERLALPARQATALAVEGMVEYAEGNAGKAMGLFEQACRLARGTLVSNILLFGHTWLALIDGRNPSPAQLGPAGQWVEATREGRFVRGMLQNKPYWAMARRQLPVVLGTGVQLIEHGVCDVGEGGHVSYAHHLPLPV
jgi:DNA-binding winged helix-turn-helix (wHTH) protein